MSRHVLFFSVSGPRCTGRTTLYQNLEKRAPETFPKERFAFIGNPFESLPHPLTWQAGEQALDPTTRLLRHWTELNEFCCKKLVPALEQATVIISDGFGLDALLYAIAGVDEHGYEATTRLHHQLVAARLKAQDIRPPVYLLVEATDDCIANWVEGSELGRFSMEAVRSYVQNEQRAIDSYFDPQHGQNPPTRLQAQGVTHERLCLGALDQIERAIRRRNLAQAA